MTTKKSTNQTTKSRTRLMTLAAGTLILIGSYASIADLSQSAEGQSNDKPLPPGYTDCGEGIPPSGPYLDINESAVYDYDCILDSLTYKEQWDDPLTECKYRVVDGTYYPLQGACALVQKNSHSWIEKHIFMAVVGPYETVDSYAHYHSWGPEECDDSGWVPTIGYPVTYINQSRECPVDECLSYSAHATAVALSGWKLDFAHHGSSHSCA